MLGVPFGARAAQGKELRSRADPQQRRLPLARLNRHPEEALVELQRAFRIGHAEGHVVERADRNRRGARRLREEPRRNGQRGHGPEKASSIDWVDHRAAPRRVYPFQNCRAVLSGLPRSTWVSLCIDEGEHHRWT